MKNKLELVIILIIVSIGLFLANNSFEFKKMTGNAINLVSAGSYSIINIILILFILIILIIILQISSKSFKKKKG